MVKIEIDDKEYEIPDTLEKGDIELDTLDGFLTDDEENSDTLEMENLKKDKLLQKGSDVSKALQNRDYAFLISDDPLPNDSIFTINGKDLRIAGRLKYNIFDEDGVPANKVRLIQR